MADGETEEAAVEPDPVLKKCFKKGGTFYYGDCKVVSEETPDAYVRHGFGRQIATQKTTLGETVTTMYEGEWVDDVMSGQGKYTWPDGSVYEGAYVEGMPHGVGTLTWPGGSTYDGTWCKGEMEGIGRFDARGDGEHLQGGDFLQGRFHRDCFQMHDGRWLNVRMEQSGAESRAISDGDGMPANVRRCTNQNELADLIAAIREEGMVPFILSDGSTGAKVTEWLPGGTTIDMAAAAKARQQQRNYRRLFYDPIKEALLETCWCTMIFGEPSIDIDQGEGQQNPPIPAEWRLANFFDDFTFPLAVFSPKLFDGRDLASFFLRDERRKQEKEKKEAAAAAAAVAEDAADAPAADPDPPGEPPAEEQEPQPLGRLRLCLAGLEEIPTDLSNQAVLEFVSTRYDSHVPLHCCTVVLMSTDVLPSTFAPAPRRSNY